MRTSPLLILTAALAVTACGSELAGTSSATSSASSRPAEPPSTTTATKATELMASTTVLEAPGAGAQLCLGGVAASLPPQCGGPVIENWEWAQAPKHEEVNGVRWGEFVVIGTYDAAASTFHLTRPVTTPQAYAGPQPPLPPDPDFGTPCPEPAGGWQVVDPAKATHAAQDAMLEAATKLPGYAGAWLDQSINKSQRPEAMNDPVKLIINVQVTDDIAAAESALREIWGGMLCVSQGTRDEVTLQKVQHALSKQPGLLSSSIDMRRGLIEMVVVHDDGSVQEAMDAAYGPGLVLVRSALQPYPG